MVIFIQTILRKSDEAIYVLLIGSNRVKDYKTQEVLNAGNSKRDFRLEPGAIL